MADRRVQFDFEIEFSNGGGLTGRQFRLDIAGDDISEEALADYVVNDMRLLMVRAVRIRYKSILTESHKRGLEAPRRRRLVDVSHDIEDGMITSLNIDDTADLRRSAHSILLRHNIPIVEHLCGLEHLPDAGFRFFAVPVKVRAFGTFPVRAFALIPDDGSGPGDGGGSRS